MIPSHPIDLSREIAALIESDPIAARQIKDHIPEKRLGELLDIPVLGNWGDFGSCVSSLENRVVDAVKEHGKVALLYCVLKRFSKAEVIAVLNRPS